MAGRVVRVGIVVSVLLGVVAACGSSDRPRGLSIDGVKPCGLIPDSDLHALRVTAPPESADVVEGANEKGTSCTYSPQYGGNVYVSEVTNEGIGRWTSDTRNHAVVDVPRILGYRTIKVSDKGDPSGPHDSCTLYVDVASGESLKVYVSESSNGDPSTCDTAHRFGEAAMKTLTQQ